MKLIERIKNDRLLAFKERNDIKKNLLGCLVADASKLIKDPDDAKIVSTVKSFIGNAEETIKTLEKTENISPVIRGIILKLQMEIDILNEYVPQQLSETEITNVITALRFLGTDLGKTMKHFKENFAGRYDGGLVSKIAKELL